MYIEFCKKNHEAAKKIWGLQKILLPKKVKPLISLLKSMGVKNLNCQKNLFFTLLIHYIGTWQKIMGPQKRMVVSSIALVLIPLSMATIKNSPLQFFH